MSKKTQKKAKDAEIAGLEEESKLPAVTDESLPTRYEPEKMSVERLITAGIQNNISVESMERLLAMRKDLKAEFAKEQFDEAMAKFQGECPVIVKSKAGGETKNNQGKAAYYYAPLDVIVTQTKDLIKDNGFSYMVKTETKDQGVKVTVIVKHKAGHQESTDVEVPLGTRTGIMSASQVTASALTFAKRYAFCNAFGILTGDEDDDAAHTGQPANPAQTPAQGQNLPNQTPNQRPQVYPISPAQMRKMYAQASNLGNTKDQLEDWIFKVCGVNGIEKLTSAQASKFIDAMDKKLVELAKKEENLPDIQMNESQDEGVEHEPVITHEEQI